MIKRIIRKLMPNTPEKKARRELLSINLTPSDIVIDCGANIGKVTKYLAKAGSTVYAFEPNPFAFEVLKNNLSSHRNVHCIQKGVSDENTVLKLYMHENSGQDEVKWSVGSSFLENKGNVLGNKYEEIEVIDFCEFIESLGSRVKIVKMDIEGVECKILQKLIDSGTIDKIEHIFVETHDKQMPELKEHTDKIRKAIKEKNLNNINLDWT